MLPVTVVPKPDWRRDFSNHYYNVDTKTSTKRECLQCTRLNQSTFGLHRISVLHCQSQVSHRMEGKRTFYYQSALYINISEHNLLYMKFSCL